ncbi:MAG: ubiquinone biosynthesis protein UbiA [Chloroflexi bacterium RBG_16_48_8]|nr:MAG: ubiquinone biosynthesis protein UbiA [Chloroflexi bacterium RBG_16_48_8]
MSDKKWIMGPMRIPFLIVSPACVLVGIGTAAWSPSSVSIVEILLVLIGAVAAHISVNAFNEYYDFKTGLDFRTRRTPFSGGSGTLPERPDASRSALAIAWISFSITALVGIIFVIVRGPLLLPVGFLGLILLVVYTLWLTRNPILCLVAPGLGFGILMVMGSHFALTGQYSWTSFIASLVPFFLVSNLLLINQFPDVEADKTVGRRHYPIVIGRAKSAWIYVTFLLLVFIVMMLGVLIDLLPPLSLLGLVGLLLAIPTMIGVVRNAENIEKLIPFLSLNVLMTILTPILFGVGILLS